MREVPKKNYIILIVMTISVVLICFVLMNIYNKNNKDVYKSVMKDVINEIKYQDLDNYLQENPDVILYINDISMKNQYEPEIKKIIADNNIQQYFVYLEKDEDVVNKYRLNSNNPVFIYYKNGQIIEVFSRENYTIDEIKNFFIRSGVIEND